MKWNYVIRRVYFETLRNWKDIWAKEWETLMNMTCIYIVKQSFHSRWYLHKLRQWFQDFIYNQFLSLGGVSVLEKKTFAIPNFWHIIRQSFKTIYVSNFYGANNWRIMKQLIYLTMLGIKTA